MTLRIVVLEKDTTFLRELELGFSRYETQIEVVSSVDASVAMAKSGPVALVLLSVDAFSAPSDALLACRRFKTDAVLAKIPLVLMGGARHAELFEAHKRLARRADEYITLPVAFAELVSRLSKLISLSPTA